MKYKKVKDKIFISINKNELLNETLLNLAEKEIQKVGFKKCELMATQSGVPLYKHHGYSEIEEFIYKSSRGNVVKMLKMGKLF